MVQLNLLPDIKKEFIKAHKTKNMVVSLAILATVGALGLTVVLFLYVNLVQKLQLDGVNASIKTRTDELKKVNEIDKYLTIQNQLKSLPELHSAKPLYSRLFTFLPTLNPGPPNSSKLSNLQVDAATKTINFTGSSPSFEAFNIFVDTLKNAQMSFKPSSDKEAVAQSEKVFEAVEIDSANLGRTGSQTLVNFVIRATYKDAVFSPSSYELTISVPSIQTTESVNNSPKAAKVFDGATPGDN